MSTGLFPSPLLTHDPNDQRTVRNTHPPDWRNPTPRARYDLVVIGGGTAGLVSAGTGALVGARVALVERYYTGGDCLINGCVPSKALLRSARAAADARAGAALGMSAAEVQVDFPKVMERVRAVRAQISSGDAARSFQEEYGVDVFFGDATFTAPDHIAVDGMPLRFRKAIIATGSRPSIPSIAGLAGENVYTNETIFTIDHLPARLAVIGGGPLGCELAQAFARLGAHVTLIQRGKRLLPRDDAQAGATLLSVFLREGVAVHLETTIDEVSRSGGSINLSLNRAGSPAVVDVDAVLIAAGREANLLSLGLHAAGVAFDTEGAKVDDFLRTTNPRIYAAGDVCLKERFTHTADASARLAAQNALLWRTKRWSRQTIPSVTYTDPEVAHVGPREFDVADCDSRTIPISEVDRAVTDGEREGFLKILTDKRSGRIRSATIVCTRAGELLSVLTAATARGQRLHELASVIYPYPTQADAIKKAADAALRKRLTGWPLTLSRLWTRRSG
jgi:pyruvate/2-oxoglutarate dehydrogenase complex dihydrolipoamide dehydrogenase (E3) component